MSVCHLLEQYPKKTKCWRSWRLRTLEVPEKGESLERRAVVQPNDFDRVKIEKWPAVSLYLNELLIQKCQCRGHFKVSILCLDKHSPKGSCHLDESSMNHTLAQKHLCELWCGMHRTCKNTSVMRFFASQRLENPLKVVLSFFYPIWNFWDILLLSFFYPPRIFPQFWISFFYPFFIIFLSSCPWPGYPCFILPWFFLNFGYPFFILFLSFLYPPSCKMDQNWLPQVQKAKGWGKV